MCMVLKTYFTYIEIRFNNDTYKGINTILTISGYILKIIKVFIKSSKLFYIYDKIKHNGFSRHYYDLKTISVTVALCIST